MACVQAPCARLACRQRGTAPAPGHGEHGALPRNWDGANAAFSPAGCREPPNQLTQENDLALCLLDRAIGHRHQGPERQSQPGPRGSKVGGKRGSHESQGRDSAACGERRVRWCDRRQFGTIPKLETQVVEEMEAGWRFEVIMISVPDMWSSGRSCSDRTPMGRLDVGARI